MQAQRRRFTALPLSRAAFVMIVANEIRGLISVALLVPTLLDASLFDASLFDASLFDASLLDWLR